MYSITVYIIIKSKEWIHSKSCISFTLAIIRFNMGKYHACMRASSICEYKYGGAPPGDAPHYLLYPVPLSSSSKVSLPHGHHGHRRPVQGKKRDSQHTPEIRFHFCSSSCGARTASRPWGSASPRSSSSSSSTPSSPRSSSAPQDWYILLKHTKFALKFLYFRSSWRWPTLRSASSCSTG